MKAGWLGQMAGVGWGATTEFKFNGMIIPEENVPTWKPELINQYIQDDIYVEMTFLRTLEQYGLDVSIRQAGIDFANSKYQLWHANRFGRENLRNGIAPPWSGHPEFNKHADDIDYQIEADYAGLISPGLPQAGVDLGNIFGRIMNYGDGLYGGQFVSGMYAEAFFEKDIQKIIDAGLACIPNESIYYECITDVIKWYGENPDDWQKTWELIEAKYQDNPDNRKFCCSGTEADFNIDAKINGAYIVMGMLYGHGDLDKTIVISMRCGQDSDCNPSNAAGILATSMGMENLPDKFKSALDNKPKFSYTDYNFPGLVKVCNMLTRQNVKKYGGKIVSDNGVEVLQIPNIAPKPNELEQCWDVEKVTEDYKFTEAEMAKIEVKVPKYDHYIKKWEISGPYTKEGIAGNELLFVEFPPEQRKGEWKSIILGENGLNKTNVVFQDIYGGENRVAYARTSFHSDSDKKGYLIMGTDDGVKLWHNDKLVHENNTDRGCNITDDKVQLNIQKGKNILLFKIRQGTGGWEMAACFTDAEGNSIKLK